MHTQSTTTLSLESSLPLSFQPDEASVDERIDDDDYASTEAERLSSEENTSLKTQKHPAELRVFFVKPPQWVTSDMVPALIRAEVPGHVIDDHTGLKRICDKYPGSLIVINGDKISGNDKIDWKSILASYTQYFARSRMTVAFMDRGLSEERRNALRLSAVTMAFIELNQSFRTLQNILFTLAVKICKTPRRSFIRIGCETGQYQPEFNVKMHGIMVRGYIRDISSSGMACYLADDAAGKVLNFSQGEEVRGMQLLLRGTPVLVSGYVAAVRNVGDLSVSVIMFRWRDDVRGRDRIHQYIGQKLQEDFRKAVGLL